jgi:hypothetical protein
VFLDENARRECIHTVCIEDRHDPLHDNRTRVELRCHEMHGDTREFDAVFQRVFLRIHSGERRKERRVNIEDPIPERLDHRQTQDPHEPSQAYDVDSTMLEFTDQCTVVVVS